MVHECEILKCVDLKGLQQFESLYYVVVVAVNSEQ
jgi:hypothetical protein